MREKMVRSPQYSINCVRICLPWFNPLRLRTLQHQLQLFQGSTTGETKPTNYLKKPSFHAITRKATPGLPFNVTVLCLLLHRAPATSLGTHPPAPPTLSPHLCACAWWHEMLSHQRNKAGNALRPSLWKHAVWGLFSGWMCFGLFVFACFNSFHQCLCEDQVHSFTQQYAAMPHSLCTGGLVCTLCDCLRVRGHAANPLHFSF